MSMNGNDLGDLLKSTLDVAVIATGGSRQELFRALGQAIVSYIQANAVVTVVTSTSGAFIGTATLSGSGTGTIS